MGYDLRLPPQQYQDLLEEKILAENITASDVASIIRYKSNTKVKIGDVEINFLKTTHSNDSHAIKLSNKDVSLGYTGDISADDIDLCSYFFLNCDAIIAECALPQNYPKPLKHLRPYDCANLKNKSKAKSIYLTHFFPLEDEKNYLKTCQEKTDNVFIAYENLAFEL